MTLAQLAALQELNSCQAMGNAILAEIKPELPEVEQVVTDILETVEAEPTARVPLGKIKRKSVKLTQEASEWFLTNPDNMALYIRFGTRAYRKTRQECEAEAYSPAALKSETSLKPSQTDWLINKPTNESFPFSDSWTCSQHAGYYWHGVCLWRAKNSIKLAFPNWGRLGAEVKRLVDTQTSWQAHLLIYNAITFFDLVQHLIGRIGLGMVLDETSLGHSLVKQQLLQIASRGAAWVDVEMEKMRVAKEKLENREIDV